MSALLLAAALGGVVLGAPPEPLKVGVLPVQGSADGSTRARVTEVLESALSGLPGLEVVSLRGIGALLGEETAERLTACAVDVTCIRRESASVRSDRLVIATLDAEQVLRLQMVASSTTTGAQVQVRVSRNLGFDESQLVPAVTGAALDLFPERASSAFGTLALQGGLPEAKVFVDGEEKGLMSMAAPPRAALQVKAGRRQVRVVAPGHAPFEVEVEVLLGQRAEVVIELEKNRSLGPLYLAGAGVVAAGVATGLALAVQSRANQWEDGCAFQMPCNSGFTRSRYESDQDFVTAGRWTANTLFVAAGAAAVGALLWYWLDPGEDSP